MIFQPGCHKCTCRTLNNPLKSVSNEKCNQLPHLVSEKDKREMLKMERERLRERGDWDKREGWKIKREEGTREVIILSRNTDCVWISVLVWCRWRCTCSYSYVPKWEQNRERMTDLIEWVAALMQRLKHQMKSYLRRWWLWNIPDSRLSTGRGKPPGSPKLEARQSEEKLR